MQVTQVAGLLNDITKEYIGETAVVDEDLSNLVDIGSQLFDATSVDNYVRSLLDKVGKMIAVNRSYKAPYPNILREGWEYGAVMQKIRTTIPEAVNNPSWSLSHGSEPNPFEYNPPTVVQKFWTEKSSFEIPMSFAEIQVKSAFNSRNEMMSFISMIENSISTSLTIKRTSVVQRAINRFVAEKIHASSAVIPLITNYVSDTGDSTVTAANAIYKPEFLRYAAMTMSMYRKRLNYVSLLFNVGDIPTFTPDEYLHFIVNDQFAKAIDVYLSSDTYHNELVKLSGYETVPFWQGSGTGYTFTDCTKIEATIAENVTVSQGYIVGIMFDRDAIMVCNENYRTTTAYNARGEYYNNFYKSDFSSYNDLQENGIIFILS